jgi:DNA-binding transcriptional MerR regulator
MMKYTVKQLADIAGVSRRTLHYYDEIGLLMPSAYGENGYRYYGENEALRLQQILFFRELDFGLDKIQAVLDEPDFDALMALQTHKQALQQRAQRLNNLIQTIEKTILHLEGQLDMSTEEMFEEFTEEKQKQYEQEAYKRYDPETVQASVKRWQSYPAEKKAAIKAEGNQIYLDLAAQMAKGVASEEVQALIGRWHQHIRHFYEPTMTTLQGLGYGYEHDPSFAAFYARIHPDLPQFIHQAIDHYCQNLTNLD